MPGAPFGGRAEPRRAGLSVLEELGSHLPEDLEVVVGELDRLGESLIPEGPEGVENEGPVLRLGESSGLEDIIQMTGKGNNMVSVSETRHIDPFNPDVGAMHSFIEKANARDREIAEMMAPNTGSLNIVVDADG